MSNLRDVEFAARCLTEFLFNSFLSSEVYDLLSLRHLSEYGRFIKQMKFLICYLPILTLFRAAEVTNVVTVSMTIYHWHRDLHRADK